MISVSGSGRAFPFAPGVLRMRALHVEAVCGLALSLPLVPGRAAEKPAAVAADLVLLGGKIWTGDKEHPEAQALAAWGGRVLRVGDDADVRPLAGPGARVVDLGGKRVVPGFNDSHAHVLGGGLALSQVALKDAADEAEFGRRLREFDQKLPPGRWMVGGLWDHDRTFGGKYPTAAILDKYVSGRPAFLRRYDGHMAVANTKALALAGVTAATADPPGGVVGRLADGKTPDGTLRDNAMSLVGRVVPPPSDDEVAEAVQAALAEARSFGLTGLQDMDGGDAATRRRLFRVYQRLAKAGRLTARIDLRWPIADAGELAALGAEAAFGGDWLTVGGVKGFADGSLGSSTAKMFDPYLNEPGNTGQWVTPPGRLRELVAAADRAGLSVAVHAIGDRADAELLDVYAEVARADGPRDRRFRIEHAQHLRPEDYPRFRELGVVASMQPYHAVDDGRWAEGRIGAKRCASSYAYRALLDAGARLAFGSDWPVAPLDVLAGVDAAVNRRPLDGKHPGGWHPAQRITVAEAVEAYTAGSAYAQYQEKDRGALKPGMLADLAVLSRDIFAEAERDHIADTKVVLTVVGGKVVFERKP
jgi:predicted amidohydrolase YtcJ